MGESLHVIVLTVNRPYTTNNLTLFRTLFLASMPALRCMRFQNLHLFSDMQLYGHVIASYKIIKIFCTSILN